MKGLLIAICGIVLSTAARSSVKVEKIVPQACTQLLRVAVALNGKAVSGAEISVRPGFYPEQDPRAFISTRGDGIGFVPQLAPGNYRVDVTFTFNGIRSAVFDQPVRTVPYVHVVLKRDVSTIPIDLWKPTQELWQADKAFDQQLQGIDWRGHDRIQSLRATIVDPAGAKVPSVKAWVVRMTPQVAWEVASLGASDVNGQFFVQLRDCQYIAICSPAGFRTAIVPFEVIKDGSGELRIALKIAPASQQTIMTARTNAVTDNWPLAADN